MLFRFLFTCLFFFLVSINSYGVVRKDKISDEKYISLGNNFACVVRIETETSFGSGVVIDSDTVITSAHTVKHKRNIKIVINYTEFFPDKIVFKEDLDLAILKLKQPNIKTACITEFYSNQYLNENFVIVGYGFTGTGSIGARVRDFKKRGAEVRASKINKGFVECLFSSDDDLELGGCAAKGDSGGGVFKDNKLAGIITYVTGKGGDGFGDSTYGDRSAFIPVSAFEEWLINNL